MTGNGYPASAEAQGVAETEPSAFEQIDLHVAALEELRATLAASDVAEHQRRIGIDCYYLDPSKRSPPVRVSQCLAYVGVEDYGLCPAVVRRINYEQPQFYVRTPETVLRRDPGWPDLDLGQVGAMEMADALKGLYDVLKQYPMLRLTDQELEPRTFSTLVV